MGMALDGQVAVVTGAGGGIGQAVCLKLAALSVDVVVVDQDAAGAQRVAEAMGERGRKGVVLVGDVCDPGLGAQALALARERFGRLDILVNNAGMGSAMVPLWEIDPATWRHDLDVNLTSQFLMCRALVPHTRQAFRLLAADEVDRDADHVLQWAVRGGRQEFLQSEVHRELHNRFTKRERLIAALQRLQSSHCLRYVKRTNKGARPSDVWLVNPALFPH